MVFVVIGIKIRSSPRVVRHNAIRRLSGQKGQCPSSNITIFPFPGTVSSMSKDRTCIPHATREDEMSKRRASNPLPQEKMIPTKKVSVIGIADLKGKCTELGITIKSDNTKSELQNLLKLYDGLFEKKVDVLQKEAAELGLFVSRKFTKAVLTQNIVNATTLRDEISSRDQKALATALEKNFLSSDGEKDALISRLFQRELITCMSIFK